MTLMPASVGVPTWSCDSSHSTSSAGGGGGRKRAQMRGMAPVTLPGEKKKPKKTMQVAQREVLCRWEVLQEQPNLRTGNGDETCSRQCGIVVVMCCLSVVLLCGWRQHAAPWKVFVHYLGVEVG